jgi:hypothetical protein
VQVGVPEFQTLLVSEGTKTLVLILQSKESAKQVDIDVSRSNYGVKIYSK